MCEKVNCKFLYSDGLPYMKFGGLAVLLTAEVANLSSANFFNDIWAEG